MRGLQVLFMVVFLYITLIGVTSQKVQHTKANEPQAKSAVQVLTKNTFASTMKRRDTLCFVVFHSEKCGHCKRLMPEVEKAAEMLENDAHVIVATVDVIAQPLLAIQYDIHALPTMLVFRGDEYERYHGERNAAYIYKWLLARKDTLKKLDTFKGSNDKKVPVAQKTDSSNTKRQSFLERAKECETICEDRRATLPECDFFCIDESCFNRIWGTIMFNSADATYDLEDPELVAQFTRCAKLRRMPAIPNNWKERSVGKEKQKQYLEDWKEKQRIKKEEREKRKREQFEQQKVDRAALEAEKERRRQQSTEDAESTENRDEL